MLGDGGFTMMIGEFLTLACRAELIGVVVATGAVTQIGVAERGAKARIMHIARGDGYTVVVIGRRTAIRVERTIESP